MNIQKWIVKLAGVSLVWAATAIALPAQSLTTLFNFDRANGTSPYATLLQAANGNMYGSVPSGGPRQNGGIFSLTSAGVLRPVFALNGTDGSGLEAPLVQGTDGKFYGVTSFGGAQGDGVVFSLTAGGQYTVLYNFCSLSNCADGNSPLGGLAEGPDGNYYGTTSTGGMGTGAEGTIFQITPAGVLTTLHSFSAGDGTDPSGTLILGSDGKFYGTTSGGPPTLFSITSSGVFQVLTLLIDNPEVYSGVIQATDGNFYGTSHYGGTIGNGVVYKVTPTGALSVVYNFCSNYVNGICTDGSYPGPGSLTQASDGNFYGTTTAGGTSAYGIAYELTPSGVLTVLANFDGPNGREPQAGLLQNTNGTFYGTTEEGGSSVVCTSGCGTVFSLATGLTPFVTTILTAGSVGNQVGILGTNLSGSTSVTFNGTAASFTVKSPALILTTVPAGATSGFVQVVTPGGTLTSNNIFSILP
jgi:uncharacterized repeat protein (TIGR03803 family)